MSWLLASAPALPLHTAGKYVAGAYVVFLAIVLIYVAIMASRLRHTERDLVELRRDLEAAQAAGVASVESADDDSLGGPARAELPAEARR